MSRRNDYDYLILIISMTALIPVNIVADSNSAVLQAMPQDRHHSVPSRRPSKKKENKRKTRNRIYYRCERIV